MSNALLEQTRSGHESMERLERLVVQDLKRTMTKHKDRLSQDHRVNKFVEEIQEQAAKLIKIYEDEDGTRAAEIAKLGGPTVFSSFYERLKEVREYHRKFPETELTAPEDTEELINATVSINFTGEEMNGRYLDLHEHYHAFINSKFGQPFREDDKPMAYLTYVDRFSHFHLIDRTSKFGKPYADYLEALLRYLESFHTRTQPLKNLGRLLAKAEATFEEQWAAGEVLGWEGVAQGGGGAPESADVVIDVEAFDSVEELETLGGEKLKEALTARGMKCGGTLRQRAERLMLARGKALHELPAAVFAKGAVPPAALGEAQQRRRLDVARRVALLEAKALALVESLGSVVDDTHVWVEKKLAQNYEELKQDLEREDWDVHAEGSDEEGDYVYNPLKLPLGPDGKPIPYWLYKLHGLNQDYPCEICGNMTYRGRRAYEKHFTELRHMNGLRALGIQPSKAFFEVTNIAEASSLWESLKMKSTGSWKPEQDEEFEDADGNVYNRRTYEDLKRQGLL